MNLHQIIPHAIVALLAHLGGSAALATPQDPSVLLTLPDGSTALRLRIESDLEAPSGSAWITPVWVTVSSPSWDYSTAIEATPSPSGHIRTFVYLPLSYAFERWDIRVWGTPHGPALRTIDGPFLSAEEGQAANHQKQPVGDTTNGAVANLGLSVIAPPPLAGTLQLSAPSQDGLRLGMDNGMADRWTPGMATRPMAWTEQLPMGTTTIPFYSWGTGGFWDAVFYDEWSRPLISKAARRGVNITHVTIPPQIHVQVTVSGAAYEFATKALLIDPAFHSPNPNVPSGSDTDFSTQFRRASASAPFLELSPTELQANLFCLEESMFLEVWGMDLTDLNAMPELLGYQQIPAGEGPHVVNF